METCLFVCLILSVDHIVVDTDDPFVKVAVFPAQANGFTDTASSTKQDSEQGEPMIINFVISHIVNKCRLLCDGQRVTLWLLPVVALFDFRHRSGSSINRQLTRYEHHSVCFNSLTVRADCPRSFLTTNYFFHNFTLLSVHYQIYSIFSYYIQKKIRRLVQYFPESCIYIYEYTKEKFHS